MFELVVLAVLAVSGFAQVDEFAFNELKSCVPFTVKVVPGSGYGIELIGDDSILSAISAEIDVQADGWRILNIQTTEPINTKKTLGVQVSLPSDDAILRKITLSGSGDVQLEMLQTSNEFVCENKGSGNLVVRASSKEMRIILSGDGDVAVSGAYQKATVTSSGTGDVYLQGAIEVEVDASSEGTLFVDGVAGFSSITGEHTGSGVVFSRGATCDVGPLDADTSDFQRSDPGAPVVAVARQVAVAGPGQSVTGRQSSIADNQGSTVTTSGNAGSNQCVPAQGDFPSTEAPFTCGLVIDAPSQCGGDFVLATATPCEDQI
eukprot:TRINITY_DN1072_c0_g1_i13.p1 TRINITY_DN1072_c0_g1~~TRINITY_DN1072_c0_g1_i13.p1  ORF type:complete len:319 (+),score=93.86 TRINITY_DN1072_c0_g1_i13:191-1147(+)